MLFSFGCGAYIAPRILLQNGFKAKNVSGGTLLRVQNTLCDTLYLMYINTLVNAETEKALNETNWTKKVK